jgi:hypothetical protein
MLNILLMAMSAAVLPEPLLPTKHVVSPIGMVTGSGPKHLKLRMVTLEIRMVYS